MRHTERYRVREIERDRDKDRKSETETEKERKKENQGERGRDTGGQFEEVSGQGKLKLYHEDINISVFIFFSHTNRFKDYHMQETPGPYIAQAL